MESDTDFNTETAHWAVWKFEKAVLSVRIKEGKVCAVEYLANENIADAKETPETKTDLWTDRRAGSGSAEAVYRWSAYGLDSDNGYAMYHPYDDDYDMHKVDAFIQNYLQAQGIDKKTPDGTSYTQNDDLFVEYYVDREKGQYCFIVHLWDEYWLDYDNGISQYQDAVYCTTYTLQDDDKRKIRICRGVCFAGAAMRPVLRMLTYFCLWIKKGLHYGEN